MRIFIYLSLVIYCTFLFSFQSEKKTITIEEFGTQIFNACKNNDFEVIQSLIVTTDEISRTIDASNTTDSLKQILKSSFIKKLEDDKEKSFKNIKRGFEYIKENMSSKPCDSLMLGKIVSKVKPLRNIPLEIGDLEIEYFCGEDSEKIRAFLIKTVNGLRIVEDLGLVYKERN
jgi:hypothetical protein